MIKTLSIFAPLFVIALLFVFTVRFGLEKVGEIRSKVATERRNEQILSQKLSILGDVGDTVGKAGITSSVLPDSNPALMTISQLKNLASNLGLILSNLKSGSESKTNSGISKVGVTFDIEGDRSVIFKFLEGVQNIAPISVVEKIKLTQTGPSSLASVTVGSYFAELPKKLPAMTEAITALTSDESKTLEGVLGLTQPQFSELPPPQEGAKTDPFTP